METLFDAHTRAGIEPRDYLIKDHDESFRLWDSGVTGVLTRAGTGAGKTPMACAKIDTWLKRGDSYKAMIVSYERQLVWQFAQEVEDFLGITPGIEMGTQAVDPEFIPRVVVASRQTLLRASGPTAEQRAELLTYGIKDLGAAPERVCKKFITFLKKGGDQEQVKDEILRLREEPEVDGDFWARLHKFDWRYNWLIVFDEAHRHAFHLGSIRHVVEWFERNDKSKRSGITATPKRSDNVSIGDRMFPGIALDYPLYSPSKPCMVKDGWAVPYVQKYIQVEGIDFRDLKKIKGDFDEAEMEKMLGKEEMLAKLVLPLLDMVGNRRTLIFSPGVEMAKNVARFINARCETICECGKIKWQPRKLIGDGAMCECGKLIDTKDITKHHEQAKELDGESPESERRQIYRDFEKGDFQFLSVCGLCREGYNNPSLSCVAIFRPVSKAASSLAEQMKGRSCRPLRGLLKGLPTKEDRLSAIANSAKPNALIVDLVGITGLADCASTAQIYAEGLADELRDEYEEDADAVAQEIIDRAEEILAERGLNEETSVEEAIAQAKREDEETRERIRLEREKAEQAAREEAEKRAKANANVKYTEHEVGNRDESSYDPLAGTDKQYRFAEFLGMEVKAMRSKKQLNRIIDMLSNRMPFAEVARLNRLDETQWAAIGPSVKQIKLMEWKKVPTDRATSKREAGLLIDAKLEPEKFVENRRSDMAKATTMEKLNSVAIDIKLVSGVLPANLYQQLVEAGKEKRKSISANDEPIPD